jgi:hypothetical protein
MKFIFFLKMTKEHDLSFQLFTVLPCMFEGFGHSSAAIKSNKSTLIFSMHGESQEWAAPIEIICNTITWV